MSEFLKAIEEMVQVETSKNISTFVGLVTDYDPIRRMCTIRMSLPTGVGHITLSNRLVPDNIVGLIPGFVRSGSLAIMTAPQGQYTFATIVSILPPNEKYDTLERVEESKLPRLAPIFPSMFRLKPW